MGLVTSELVKQTAQLHLMNISLLMLVNVSLSFSFFLTPFEISLHIEPSLMGYPGNQQLIVCLLCGLSSIIFTLFILISAEE